MPAPTLDPQYAFLPHIERNVCSLYATLDFLLTTQQYETAVSLIHSIYPYWETCEYLSVGVSWLSKFTSPLIESQVEQSSISVLSLMLGNLLRHQSFYQSSQAHYQRSLKSLNTQSNLNLHTSILSGLGETAFRQGRYDAAVGFYQSHLVVGQAARDDCRVADAYNALGRLATVKGDFTEAREYHDHGHHLCQQQGYRLGLAWQLNAVGELERARGNHRTAVAYFRESAATFEQAGNVGASMLALQNLAFVTLPNNLAYAEQLLNRLLAFWRRGPARHAIALCLIGLSRVELAKGKDLQAVWLHCAAAQLLSRVGARLELGDATDYEIALFAIQKKIGLEQYQRVLAETSCLSLDELTHPDGQFENLSSPSPIRLTRQERAVLSHAADGLTDKQIAHRLVISPYTVNAHLKSIYRKLSANSRTSAIAAARRQNLI